MKCCDMTVNTAFCPHCGKQTTTGIKHLLLFVERHEKTAKEKLDIVSKECEKSNKNLSDDYAVQNAKRGYNKWHPWAEALRELMTKKGVKLKSKTKK